MAARTALLARWAGTRIGHSPALRPDTRVPEVRCAPTFTGSPAQAGARQRCALLPAARGTAEDAERGAASTRQLFRKKLREGDLDEREIEIEISGAAMGVEIMAPPGMEEMTSQLQSMFSNLSAGRSKKRRLSVRAALKMLSQKFGTEEKNGTIIHIKLTHKDVANFAAVSRETASRIISAMIKAGEIEMIDHKYFFLKHSFYDKIRVL